MSSKAFGLMLKERGVQAPTKAERIDGKVAKVYVGIGRDDFAFYAQRVIDRWMAGAPDVGLAVHLFETRPWACPTAAACPVHAPIQPYELLRRGPMGDAELDALVAIEKIGLGLEYGVLATGATGATRPSEPSGEPAPAMARGARSGGMAGVSDSPVAPVTPVTEPAPPGLSWEEKVRIARGKVPPSPFLRKKGGAP